MATLRHAFNATVTLGVMCRSTLSIHWSGHLQVCGLNQMLGLPVNQGVSDPIRDFKMDRLAHGQIAVSNHPLCVPRSNPLFVPGSEGMIQWGPTAIQR